MDRDMEQPRRRARRSLNTNTILEEKKNRKRLRDGDIKGFMIETDGEDIEMEEFELDTCIENSSGRVQVEDMEVGSYIANEEDGLEDEEEDIKVSEFFLPDLPLNPNIEDELTLLGGNDFSNTSSESGTDPRNPGPTLITPSSQGRRKELRIVCWNINGVNNPEKVGALRKMTRNVRPLVILLQEIKSDMEGMSHFKNSL